MTSVDGSDENNDTESRAEKSSTKKDPTTKIGDVIKLYAYKDCLGKYDSLIRNPDMPLWYRDGSILCQKLLHTRCDDDGLFYSSTQIFSCWEKERADEYVELDAEIVTKKNINFVAKILDIDTVEALCSNGNFKELGLEPYTTFEMRAAQNPETDLPKLIPSDSSSEDLYKTPDDSISSDD